MAFIKQEGLQNSCGAFCLCYLKWLNEGRSPQDEESSDQIQKDYDLVDHLYAFVQFGDGAPRLPTGGSLPRDYCDPVRMLALLWLQFPKVAFYIDGDEKNMMMQILKEMWGQNTREGAFLDALNEAGGLRIQPPPALLAGQSSIAIYNMFDSAPFPRGQHYILFRKGASGLDSYNPWDGTAKPCKGYDTFTYGQGEETITLSPANAVIQIS